VTTGVGCEVGLTRLIGLDKTDSVELRYNVCLIRRNEGQARKNKMPA
jgi:hypothetical protein